MTDESIKRVLERVQKLLNLANDKGATEGERDNAMRMAHATLAKYNLDMEQVESHKTRKDDRGILKTEFGNWIWARHVANSVAELFFCHYVCSTSKSDHKGFHYFIGKEANARTASMIAEFAVKAIAREGDRQMRELGERWPYFRSFGMGAAARIRARVDEMKKDQTQVDSAPGTALVLASLYERELAANKKFLEEKGFKTSKSRGGGRLERDGYYEGVQYGDTVSLNRQVGSTVAPHLRLK